MSQHLAQVKSRKQKNIGREFRKLRRGLQKLTNDVQNCSFEGVSDKQALGSLIEKISALRNEIDAFDSDSCTREEGKAFKEFFASLDNIKDQFVVIKRNKVSAANLSNEDALEAENSEDAKDYFYELKAHIKQSEHSKHQGQRSSRRGLIAGMLAISTVGVVASPRAKAGWFGEEGIMIVTAIWQFASKLWTAMNDSIQSINGMFNGLSENLGKLEEKMHAGTTATIEAGALENSKTIAAVGASADKISEQLVANERTKAALAAQPSSGVCGDDVLTAALNNTGKLVEAQTKIDSVKKAKTSVKPAATDDNKGDKERTRQQSIEKVVQGSPSDDANWTFSALSYADTIKPTSIQKSPNNSKESDLFLHFASSGLPNSSADELDADYLKTGNSAYATMIFQLQARKSVATDILTQRKNENIADPAVYAGVHSHLKNNINTQKAELRSISDSNDKAVNKGRLALSEQHLAMLNQVATPTKNPQKPGLSQLNLEQFRRLRWTGPEYHAYLNTTGPEAAPLLRDLIKLTADKYDQDHKILNELRNLSSLQAMQLLEMIDGNAIRREEISGARISGRN